MPIELTEEQLEQAFAESGDEHLKAVNTAADIGNMVIDIMLMLEVNYNITEKEWNKIHKHLKKFVNIVCDIEQPIWAMEGPTLEVTISRVG